MERPDQWYCEIIHSTIRKDRRSRIVTTHVKVIIK